MPSSSGGWDQGTLVYSLRRDPDALSWLRETDHLVAKRESDGPLVGSDVWWQAIEDGRIPTKHLEGVITRVFEERQGDWPRFDLSTPSGVTTWTREGDPAAYRPGQRARVCYLPQRFLRRAYGVTERPVTLEIWLGAG